MVDTGLYPRDPPLGEPQLQSPCLPGGSASGDGAPGGHQGHLSPERGCSNRRTHARAPGLVWRPDSPSFLPFPSQVLGSSGHPTHNFISVSASGDLKPFPWPLGWDFCPLKLKWLTGPKDLPFLGQRPCQVTKVKQLSSKFDILHSRESSPWGGGVQCLANNTAPRGFGQERIL